MSAMTSSSCAVRVEPTGERLEDLQPDSADLHDAPEGKKSFGLNR
jgi:hypothetical protein